MKITPFSVLAAVFALSGCADLHEAVIPGQKTIDPKILPLVCITFGLQNAELPVLGILITDLNNGRTLVADVSSNDSRSQPKVLVTMDGPNRQLSMLILHLHPGRYELRSIDLEGGSNCRFTVDISKERQCRFTVKPECVNYVGSVLITANWRSMFLPRDGEHFPVFVRLLKSGAHDRVWAENAAPGMAAFPSEISEMDEMR